jgi:hypothetical protein
VSFLDDAVERLARPRFGEVVEVRTMPAIDSRIAEATMSGPYMAAAPFRG